MIRVSAPATIGNIGPGFDTLGLAVRGLKDIIEAERIPHGVEIAGIEDAEGLPDDPEKNTAGIAAMKTLRLLGFPGGVRLHIKKGMRGGSGLGSSAASAAAAAFAVNHLYGNRLTRKALILPATAAECAVSGSFFADNTAPALLGGAVVITRGASPLRATPLGIIDNLKIILVTPEVELLTRLSRSVLPEHVSLDDCVRNLSNSCGITAAFSQNDYRLFARCLEDVIAEPARSALIPGFDDVRDSARRAGAAGVAISGSGPTMFAITDSELNARGIEMSMVEAFEAQGISCSSLITEPDPIGATLIEEAGAAPRLAKEAEVR